MVPELPTILLPLIVNNELSPPTDAPERLPEASTVTSRVNDSGDVPVLTTLSWLDDVLVRADSNAVTPLRFVLSAVDSVPVLSTSSFCALKDSPISLIVKPFTDVPSTCSIWVMIWRMVPSPNRTEFDDAVPSGLVVCCAITSSRNAL